VKTIIRILLDLPRPYDLVDSQRIQITWMTWGKRRAAFFSWPSMAVLYLIGVFARVHVTSIFKGWNLHDE